jgi:Site-specific DNA methylase
MFSGIGGFEYGIDNGSILQSTPSENIQDMSGTTQRQTRFTCIGYSEIDKYAIAIYDYHYGGHKNYGNARNIDTKQLPDFDLLVGGFPCQAFSIAGKRKGFDDTRGTLFL